MSLLRSPDIGKSPADWKSKNDHLSQRGDMNNELEFLPIPVNSKANQLIHDFRKLNQFMEYNMERLNDILLQRLTMKGIAPSIIPRFIKDLTYTLAIDAQMNLGEINRRLHLLGWYDVEVDEHTLQLILATA
jgi:hypothetical protein